MGEHKLNLKQITEALALELSKIATDKGQLIQLGWIGMLRYVVPKDAGEMQVAEMRKSFFMGCEYLFQSLVAVVDPGSEITADDLKRMDQIDTELKAFRKEVTSHHKAPKRTQ